MLFNAADHTRLDVIERDGALVVTQAGFNHARAAQIEATLISARNDVARSAVIALEQAG